MAADKKFEIINPSLDKLVRKVREVGALGLLNPFNASPLPLIDGELVALVNGKWVRATDATKPSFFWIEDRGDLGVQASKKGAAVVGGGNFWANTVLFDPALTVEGTAVKLGTVTVDNVSRAGLVAQGGTGIIKGYVMIPAAMNSGKLQVMITDN